MIWIIGGTSEFGEIMDRIKDLDGHIGTIATEGGLDFFSYPNISVGRMDENQMLEFIEKNQIALVVDMSHPYAKVVSKNARNVCAYKNIQYIRYHRARADYGDEVIYVNSYEEAYESIEKISGTVFFTTGSKNIKDFEKVRGNNRFMYRILPAIESIEECKKHNVNMKDIVAAVGPFSKLYNEVMFKEYKADYIVSKDSGTYGGTKEKLDAAKALGIKVILIGRDEEDGIQDMETLEMLIRKHSASSRTI